MHPNKLKVVPISFLIGAVGGISLAFYQNNNPTVVPTPTISVSPLPTKTIEVEEPQEALKPQPPKDSQPKTGEDYRSEPSRPTPQDKIREEQSTPPKGEIAPLPEEPAPRTRPKKKPKPKPTPTASPSPSPTPTDEVKGNPNLPPVKISPPATETPKPEAPPTDAKDPKSSDPSASEPNSSPKPIVSGKPKK